ncbi:hypothetical protein HZA96_05085 [Candidatus Woesearchaeota archaeon]|nr:hypothetical protein [Candidatus Woesearchaeota archaeon]
MTANQTAKEMVELEVNELLAMKKSDLEDIIYPRFKSKLTEKAKSEGINCAVNLPFQVTGRIITQEKFLRRTADTRYKKSIVLADEFDPSILNYSNDLIGIITPSLPAHYKIVAAAEGITVAYLEKERIFREFCKNAKFSISIDGVNQKLYLGKDYGLSASSARVLSLQTIKQLEESSQERNDILQVRVNADNKMQAEIGKSFGAQATGPVRTEYMFFREDILPLFQRFLLKFYYCNKEEREELKNYQVASFSAIFEVFSNQGSVCIRLLDPPFAEFFPSAEKIDDVFAKKMGLTKKALIDSIDWSREANPMLGLRGSRLGIINKEMYEMQVEAAITALAQEQIFPSLLTSSNGAKGTKLEILVPLVMNGEEMRLQYEMINKTAQRTIRNLSRKYFKPLNLSYSIGAMIEVPQACFDAGEIARYCQTLSFGTNDLTQCVYGISREDGFRFMPQYLENGIFAADPFKIISDDGIGRLMQIAIQNAKATNPEIKIGVCGEQAAQRASLQYLLQQGNIDFVAVSPYKVLPTKVAAVQEQIKMQERRK